MRRSIARWALSMISIFMLIMFKVNLRSGVMTESGRRSIRRTTQGEPMMCGEAMRQLLWWHLGQIYVQHRRLLAEMMMLNITHHQSSSTMHFIIRLCYFSKTFVHYYVLPTASHPIIIISVLTQDNIRFVTYVFNANKIVDKSKYTSGKRD